MLNENIKWLFKINIFYLCWLNYVTCICLSSLLYILSCIYCNIYRPKHICSMTCVSQTLTLHPCSQLSAFKCCHMKNGGYDGFGRRALWRDHWRWCSLKRSPGYNSHFSAFTYTVVHFLKGEQEPSWLCVLHIQINGGTGSPGDPD